MPTNDTPIAVGAAGLDADVVATQRPGTVVSKATFEVATAAATFPGPAAWHWLDPHEWQPGTQTIHLRWDGHDDAGHAVPPGDYRLRVLMTTTIEQPVTCADGSGRGIERHVDTTEGSGLAYLTVV